MDVVEQIEQFSGFGTLWNGQQLFAPLPQGTFGPTVGWGRPNALGPNPIVQL
jgi:hypothetical protein